MNEANKSIKEFKGRSFELAYDIDKNLGGEDWDRIVRWLISNVGRQDTYIEIGAQIGYMATLTLAFAEPKFSIFIEPDHETVEILRWNLEHNCHKQEGVDYVIVEKAIMDVPGEITFYKDKENPALNSINAGFSLSL